jgi:hypothetical protein
MLRACLACAVISLPASALAVEEGEWQLSLTGAYGRLRVGGQDGDGGLGRVAGHYGLTDAWSVRGELASSWHSFPGGTKRASELAAGVTYAIDVVRVIPFVDAAVAGVNLGGPHGRWDLGLGGEYLIDRRWSVAAVARYEHYVLAPSAESRPGLISVGLRLAYVFD